MSLLVVGTNHKFSPVEFREKLSFSKGKLRNALFLLKERGILKNAVILSTCHRIEIYASSEDYYIGIHEIASFLSEYYEIDRKILYSYLYAYRDKAAGRHLFGVCAGLDSLIIGELQILGQVRVALAESEHAGFSNAFLKNIFQAAVSTAKRVHAETRISQGKISVGSVAVDFVRHKIGDFSDCNILIIGVGKVTELVLKYLSDGRPSVVFVASRTFEKAKQLAAQVGGEVLRFEALAESLKRADVVISATASPHFIVRQEMLREVKKPLLIVDLAVPRDVDPEVRKCEGVELYSLEDLDTVIKKNVRQKTQEAQKAGQIIHREIEKIWQEISQLQQEPALLL